jgi:hypothetical protein
LPPYESSASCGLSEQRERSPSEADAVLAKDTIAEVLQQPSIDSFAREEPGSRRRDVIVETRWSPRATMIGHYGQLFVSWHRRPTMSMTCSPSFPPMNP